MADQYPARERLLTVAGSTGERNTLSLSRKMECEQWFTEHESSTQQNRRRTSGIVGNVVSHSPRLADYLIGHPLQFSICCHRRVASVRPLGSGPAWR